MKKIIRLMALGGLLAGFMASCSQSEVLVKNDTEQQIRYRKVYEGNKIIYRDANPNQASTLDLSDVSISDLELPAEVVVPMESDYRTSTREAGVTAQAGHTSIGMEFRLSELSRQLSERMKDLGLKSESSPEKTNVLDSDDWFAVIGFGLAVLAWIVAFIPGLGLVSLLFGVGGIVLSIMGMKSRDLKWLAIIGLVLSILYFLLILIAIVFIASVIAAF